MNIGTIDYRMPAAKVLLDDISSIASEVVDCVGWIWEGGCEGCKDCEEDKNHN